MTPFAILFITEYRILSKKGEGTFSEVLKCQLKQDGSYWACKKMKQRYDRHVYFCEIPPTGCLKFMTVPRALILINLIVKTKSYTTYNLRFLIATNLLKLLFIDFYFGILVMKRGVISLFGSKI